jgi:hypothetical protein
MEQEQYIVIAKLVENTKDKYEDYRILKFDSQKAIEEQIPAGYKKVFGPANLDASAKYLADANGGSNTPNWFGLTVAQYVLIGIVTLAFVCVVIIGAYKLQGSNSDPAIMTADDGARVLITFLVAIGTIAIAFLAILTAMILREYKERFALAKEVLTILVGILGTIVGFYFGTAGKPQNSNTNINTNTNVNSDTNTNRNTNTNTNTNTNSNTNRASPIPTATTTNTNSTARIYRLPNGKDIWVEYDETGKLMLSYQQPDLSVKDSA